MPQFYLRQFACADDANKVCVAEQHRDYLVTDRKSIDRIGYEDALHDYEEDGVTRSIEGDLNRVIETPFTASSTWTKVSEGAFGTLDNSDRVPIYGFARHLQRRNLETLRFIEAENERFRTGGLALDLNDEEADMHEWIAASAQGAHALFREGAMDTSLPPDAHAINVMVCHSPIALRSSTNPTLLISTPGRQSVFGSLFNDLRTWWLTLDRYWGAFIIAGGPPGFSNLPMPADAARVINRQYLVQHQNSLSVRYMIAEDELLDEDLAWAGYRFERRTTHGARWLKPKPTA